jgi:histidinol-phosphate aminotransferase
MLAAIADKKPALVFLAQPNNPTGNLWAEDDLVAIIEACNAPDHQGLVVLDEAYLPFSSRNHLNWLDRFENVVVMRTLSKVGLAGLRLGMLFGRKEWLSELDKIRMPYNINVLTQASAAFALKHYVVLMQQCEILKAERTSMQQKLTQLGFSVFESEANFVLAGAPESATAREIFEALKQENILIKCTDGAHPLLANTLRFTVGAPEENSALFAALGRILNAD